MYVPSNITYICFYTVTKYAFQAWFTLPITVMWNIIQTMDIFEELLNMIKR